MNSGIQQPVNHGFSGLSKKMVLNSEKAHEHWAFGPSSIGSNNIT